MYGIESYGGDSAGIEQFKLVNGPVTYPMFSTLNNDSVLDLYNITGTPKYYVICPDYTYRSSNFNSISILIDTCLAHMVSVENLKEKNINIYNNSNKIIIDLDINKYKNINIDIYDLTGKKIIATQITNNITSLYIPYNKGIYIVKLYTNSKILKTKKIVIQ